MIGFGGCGGETLAPDGIHETPLLNRFPTSQYYCDPFVSGQSRDGLVCPDLGPPNEEEVDAFRREVNRLMSQWPSGHACYQLGQHMAGRVGSVYMNPYRWQGVDPETGDLGWATGDFHSGQIHIARGFDDLNQRSIQDIVATLRHETAHAMGYPFEQTARGFDDVCRGGGSGGGPSYSCVTKFGRIEISYDGGITWSTLWEGTYTECSQYMDQ